MYQPAGARRVTHPVSVAVPHCSAPPRALQHGNHLSLKRQASSSTSAAAAKDDLEAFAGLTYSSLNDFTTKVEIYVGR
jgi:hypothetical protein